MINSHKNIKRILILGHSGFIGMHLMNKFKTTYSSLEIIGLSYPEIDLTNKNCISTLSNLFTKNTVVIICSCLKKNAGDNITNYNKNIQMIINICYALNKNPVKRILYFSSTAVYGEEIHNIDITENTQIDPTSYYGLAKYSSEVLIKKSISQYSDATAVMLRPPVIFGPGDTDSSYGPVGFINNIIQEQTVTLWGDGTELREFIFIHDIADVVQHLTFNNFSGPINIVSGKSHSFQDILNITQRIHDKPISINNKNRSKEKVDNAFSNAKICSTLSKMTFTSLEDGIKKTYLGHKIS